MRPILILQFIFCMTFWSCNSTTESEVKALEGSGLLKKITGKKFFTYDAIDYYTNDFAESKIGDLYDNHSKSELDSFRVGIILGDIPQNISDLDFIKKLPQVGYKKTLIDQSKFESIDSIFVEKTTTEHWSTDCIYVYRDILVFKKDHKIVGTAKICFDCMAHQIKGTTANIENFGQEGDYERLEKLLRK
ncbi:hypothetical protein [Bergeyella sp. RCAD1439]|uniref:hypothetical protein n=1 Tax=Bergeyella anatis TaxID=3113737 RepID=UPI002E1758E3|nr:hypothetical protein [Bergeyella sp. RCAD1439]